MTRSLHFNVFTWEIRSLLVWSPEGLMWRSQWCLWADMKPSVADSLSLLSPPGEHGPCHCNERSLRSEISQQPLDSGSSLVAKLHLFTPESLTTFVY